MYQQDNNCKINFVCSNERVKKYYEENVVLNINENYTVTVSIVNEFYFLKMKYNIV